MGAEVGTSSVCILLFLGLAMNTDKKPEAQLERLIHGAYAAESADESGRFVDRAAAVLDANKSYIPAFCRRYLEDFQDEHELGTAHSVLSVMRFTDVTIAQSARAMLDSEKIVVNYKHSACFVVAKHAGSLRPPAVKRLFIGLPPALQVSLSCDLVIHLKAFHAEDRL